MFTNIFLVITPSSIYSYLSILVIYLCVSQSICLSVYFSLSVCLSFSLADKLFPGKQIIQLNTPTKQQEKTRDSLPLRWSYRSLVSFSVTFPARSAMKSLQATLSPLFLLTADLACSPR